MTADTVTAPARVNTNSVNSAPVRPPWKPMGMNTASSTTVMAMIGPPSSRAACMAAAIGAMPSSRCRLTFSTTMMASSTTRPIASTSASSVSRLIEKPSASMIRQRADQRQRDGDDGNQHRARRPEEGEYHQHDDDQRLDQRDRDLVDGAVHEIGRVVDDGAVQARSAAGLDLRETIALHAVDDGQQVRAGRHLDADEHAGLAVEGDARLVAVGAERRPARRRSGGCWRR